MFSGEEEVAMGRYDTAVKCTQIRGLIEEKQYLTAMEEIEGMDYENVPTISDLYLFADVFLKAEKMDIAKKLYYIVYHRTASRPALYRLLMLVIQMGDLEEARELYLAYEVIAGNTLDTYELRYRLAKAEGKPTAKLIDILEHLKEDEYTEEWGLQLAKLYEMEGMREKCIEECEHLKCWFGTGKIVRKAEELKKRCMSPSWTKPEYESIPEPEIPDPEETVSFAYAPVHVEEIAPAAETTADGGVAEQGTEPAVSEPESRYESETEPQYEPEGQPESVTKPEPEPERRMDSEPAGESEPQPESRSAIEPEPQELKLEPEFQPEPEPDEAVKPRQKQGFMKRLVDYFKIDVDMFEEVEDVEPEEEERTPEASADVMEEQGQPGETTDGEEGQPAGETAEAHAPFPHMPELPRTELTPPSMETLEVEEAAATITPIESLEDRLQEMNEHRGGTEPLLVPPASEEAPVKSHPLGASALTEDIVEDISKNGIRYNTLKGAIYKIRREKGLINIALTGAAGGISLAVAKRLFKELKKVGYFEAKHIGKISADRLDTVNLDEWVEKFIGGCMYITEAPSLSNESVKNLSDLIRKYRKQIVIMLEGSYDEMDSFLNYHREFEELITYKVRL